MESSAHSSDDEHQTHYIVGYLSDSFTRLSFEREEDNDNLLLAVPEEEFEEKDLSKPIITTGEEVFSNIIYAGYNSQAEQVLEEIDPQSIQSKSVVILCFDKDEYDKAISNDFQSVLCTRSNLQTVLQGFLNTSLIINMFNKITDSILLNMVVINIIPKARIVQIARSHAEHQALVKSGANRILWSDMIMARGMVQILMTHHKMIAMQILGDKIIFEYLVTSPPEWRSIQQLEREGYQIILHKNISGTKYLPKHGKILSNDTLLLVHSIF